jgi:hypothetical protein
VFFIRFYYQDRYANSVLGDTCSTYDKENKLAQYFSQIIRNSFLRNRKLYRKVALKWTFGQYSVCVCVCVCLCARAKGEYFLAQYRISCEQGGESPSSIKARNFVVGGCLTVQGDTWVSTLW